LGCTTSAAQYGLGWQSASLRLASGPTRGSSDLASTIPSPQRRPCSMVQVAEQPSQLVVLPSSHCSVPHTTPSPQPVTSVQALLQPPQLLVLPSSHCSPWSTMPSLQYGMRWQSAS